MAILTNIRRSSFHAKTVELQLSELPPPPNAGEKLRLHLEHALSWASDVGPDVAAAVTELLSRVRETKGRAA